MPQKLAEPRLSGIKLAHFEESSLQSQNLSYEMCDLDRSGTNTPLAKLEAGDTDARILPLHNQGRRAAGKCCVYVSFVFQRELIVDNCSAPLWTGVIG